MSLSDKDLFLIEACKIGHGDTRKKIGIQLVALNTKLQMDSQKLIDELLQSLLLDGFLNEFNDKELTISRMGYYYAMKVYGYDPTSFGMISYGEARERATQVLKNICVRTSTKDAENQTNLAEIKVGNYGGAVRDQIIDILLEEGFINMLDEHGNIVITDKGRVEVIKKTYM